MLNRVIIIEPYLLFPIKDFGIIIRIDITICSNALQENINVVLKSILTRIKLCLQNVGILFNQLAFHQHIIAQTKNRTVDTCNVINELRWFLHI